MLLHFKRVVGLDEQWDLLTRMRELVVSGALAFPRQVFKELSGVKFPDAPGAWVGSAHRQVCHPQPSEATLVRVLEVAGELVACRSQPEAGVR